MLQNMSTIENEVNDTSVCVNCGKADAKNICNKCKVTTYCNAVCKKVHKKKHKKECEAYQRLAAELHDEKLFKQPPPTEEDCQICFLRIPTLHTGSTYKSCCGKVICSGCIHAPLYDNQGNEVNNAKCPFCRIPTPYSDEEGIKRFRKRVEANDAMAICHLGCYYRDGLHGLPRDYTKALELYHKAAELGYAKAYCSIGYAHDYGEGVIVDKEKAIHYYELAAMGGDEVARYNLGNKEHRAGNMDRALKHYMIATRDGLAVSLEEIKEMYSNGQATKENFTEALCTYQEYLGEIKSAQRDKAAAVDEDNRYY